MGRGSILVVLVLVGGCINDGMSVRGSEDELRPEVLDVVAGYRLPIEEVSGLGHRRVANKTSYLAIGDASAELVTFDITSSGALDSVVTHDLSSLFGSRSPQWEAVAGDGAGRAFVLSERESTIAVLDDTLTRVLHTVELVIPPDHPLANDWSKDENSRGEGMVLLANGHILIAKEKHPPALVEFAPSGSAAEGYRRELALDARPFPLPRGMSSKLFAKKHWRLKSSAERYLPDISDLSVDADGQLVLLTDQGRAIARIERQLDTTEDKIDIKAVSLLPPTITKPEGLALSAGRTLVAMDVKGTDDETLFQIE